MMDRSQQEFLFGFLIELLTIQSDEKDLWAQQVFEYSDYFRKITVNENSADYTFKYITKDFRTFERFNFSLI